MKIEGRKSCDYQFSLFLINFDQFSSITSILHVNGNRFRYTLELFLVLKKDLLFNCGFSSECAKHTKNLIESVLKTLFKMSDQLRSMI